LIDPVGAGDDVGASRGPIVD